MYKTRTLASEAIEGGKVKLNGDTIKSSKKVRIGDTYVLKRENQTLEIEVVKLIEKRVSATLAQECYKEIRNIIKTIGNQPSSFFNPNIYREKGSGRPTKRERRDIDEFRDEDF